MARNNASGKFKKLKIASLQDNEFSELRNAGIVFTYAVNSVNNFYEIYRRNRTGSKGSTTHEEQDLLRAMLVFACSGIDAVVKQLIKDSLPKIIQKDLTGHGARQEFQKFVERRLRKANLIDGEEKILSLDTNFVAQVLTSNEPRTELLGSMQKHLSADSLQSLDQLLKV